MEAMSKSRMEQEYCRSCIEHLMNLSPVLVGKNSSGWIAMAGYIPVISLHTR